MQTLTIGAYRATLKPTRNVGDFTAKLAKCNGKSRRLPLRDLRTKARFPVFEPGMSTAEYVRLYSSGDGSQLKAWEWAQLNEEPCTLYSGEDACETLPDGFDSWEAFDAAQSSSAAAESAPANAELIDAAEPVAPDDAIAPAIVACAELDAPAPAARAEPYPGCEPQRMADAMRARIAPTAEALREAAAELEARAARVPIERADDYRGAAAMLRADAEVAPSIVPGFASRGARMLQSAIARSAARSLEDPTGAPVAAVESDAPPDPEPGAGGAPLATHSQAATSAYPLATHWQDFANAADKAAARRARAAELAAGMRYVHRVKGFVGTPRQAEKMRAAWLAGAMRNAERAKDGVAEPGSLRAMLESLAVPTHAPLPGDTKPEALDDDETIPAPLDGLDVAELDDMVEFERAGGIAQPIAPAYRDDAPRATPTPSLRISPSDPRARIPARFAPVYLLQA